jgi:flavin reductase (DIM6/NTAB) family NADH-FMN oxidoreductase RutF
MDPLMDHDAFDGLMTSLDPPLAVVTTAVGEERGGCLVGFHAQSSIEPARYCIWLSKANHTYRLGLRATHLGIHFLTEDQLPLAERFGTLTGDDVDKFEGVAAEVGVGEVPILVDVPNRLVVRRVALLDEGADHVCVTTEPVTAERSGPFRPLRLSAAADLVPGHDNEERKHPPTERASN